MTDIVERLRASEILGGIEDQAADEIERLRHDLARAMENHSADLARLQEAEVLCAGYRLTALLLSVKTSIIASQIKSTTGISAGPKNGGTKRGTASTPSSHGRTNVKDEKDFYIEALQAKLAEVERECVVFMVTFPQPDHKAPCRIREDTAGPFYYHNSFKIPHLFAKQILF